MPSFKSGIQAIVVFLSLQGIFYSMISQKGYCVHFLSVDTVVYYYQKDKILKY